MKKNTQLVLAALFLALAICLPMLIGNIPQIGMALSPMHIPVLLCGFFCGYKYGAVVGFVAPLLKVAMWGMPALFPNGLAMSFELATYGLIAGLLYCILSNKLYNIYVSLIGAMIAGRIVYGTAMAIMLFSTGSAYSFEAFISAAVIGGIPGIICHIVLIPAIVIVARKTKLIKVKA